VFLVLFLLFLHFLSALRSRSIESQFDRSTFDRSRKHSPYIKSIDREVIRSIETRSIELYFDRANFLSSRSQKKKKKNQLVFSSFWLIFCFCLTLFYCLILFVSLILIFQKKKKYIGSYLWWDIFLLYGVSET
jgi:hypothetical protein